MTKKPLFFIFILILTSCHTASYYIDNPTHRTGVDFRTGEWLLNDIDCPEFTQEKLTTETLNFFNENTNNRIKQISKIHGLLIPSKIPLNPSKNQLKLLKDGTGFDFFINIKASKDKNDYGSFTLYESQKSSGKNVGSVILEVYDLNLQQIIYSKKAIGVSGKTADITNYNPNSSKKLIDNIAFFKSSNQLMFGALKKIFKDLKNTSVKE